MQIAGGVGRSYFASIFEESLLNILCGTLNCKGLNVIEEKEGRMQGKERRTEGRGGREKEREKKLKFLTSNYVVGNEQIWTLYEP